MIDNSQKKLVLSLVAQNENQVLEAGSETIGHAFIRRGYEHRIINLFLPSAGTELLVALKSGKVAFAYAFAGVGCQFSIGNGVNVWTAFATPFVNLWYDHPAYNYLQHIVDSPFVVHGYHVRDHMEARQKYLPPSSSRITYLSITDNIIPFTKEHPVRQRKNLIVYAKTAYQASALSEDWKRHTPVIQHMIWSLVEQAQADRNIDLADAAAIQFKENGLLLDDIKLFVGIIQEADAYIRAWRSDLLARALLPFPVHIFGRGWDYLKDEKASAQFHSPISMPDYMNFAMDCKIVANSNPLWRDGIHNRVGNALSQGSIILTDRTIKSDHFYKDLPNYIGFEWQDDIQDIISMALRHANDSHTDYYVAAETRLNDLMQANTPDYITQIENAVATVPRHQ